MNQRGNATSPRPAIAIVMTTGSVINPINELGKPRSCDCHDLATVPHERTELILQERGPEGWAANFNASMERTREAIRLRIEETNIAM
jgi:hypothetical protein